MSFKTSFANLAVAVAVVTLSIPLHAQEFLAYEGKNTVQEGDGGSKKLVDGVDFWLEGAPPRQFQLLGYVTDTRHKTGLWGVISMSMLESDVAKLARANGGEAVILVNSESETLGIASSKFSGGQANATAGNGSGNVKAFGSSGS